MKKSSFLHNPKDVLSKSFKPAKCKTALKLATSRMKLLKNKKQVQLQQMKKELAQLLESGQDQTARIRVEHVIREEKMMAAYDLLDIYCELIVARLPIIESQKECPIDLKEAITSVIFASPRCGDVPELLDARKLLSAKYGKEFVSAAIELRPNCGVSRLLVEKLSANAPDGQTKIKTLTKIAEEQKIKWDPKSFGQGDGLPPDDLLNGPKTFEASTVVHQAPPTPTPNFQPPPSHDKMDYQPQPMNFSQQNVRSSPGSHEFASGQNSIGRNTASSIPQAQMKPLGVRQDKGQVSESLHREGSSSFGGKSWNLEFKDATSAAQAAAESAERASMAARAAAELSSRVQTTTKPHYSSEAHNSIGDFRRDERPGKHETSKHTSDYVSQDSVKSFLSDRQPEFQNKPTDLFEQENRGRSSKMSHKNGHDTGNGYDHIASSRPASVQDETFANRVHVPDGILQKSSPKEERMKTESSIRQQSGKFETEDMNNQRGGFGTENYAYSGEDMIRKQSSVVSPGTHSKTSSSDAEFSNYGRQIFGYDAGKGPSVGKDEEYNARDTSAPSYNAADAPVIFDDSGSDGEDNGSTTGFKFNEEVNVQFASPGRSSPSYVRTDSGHESLKHASGKSPVGAISEFSPKKNSSAKFSESVEASMDHSQAENFGPVTFDDSDGSESETDVLHSEYGATEGVGRPKQSLEFSDTKIRRNDGQKAESIFGQSSISQSSLRLGKSQQESSSGGGMDDNAYLASSQSKFSSVHQLKENTSSPRLRGTEMDDENSDDGTELNFKRLTGGLRHKGYFRPPYTRSQVDDTTYPSSRVSDEGPTTIRQSAAAAPTVERFTNTRKGKVAGNGGSSRVADNYSDSDSDASIEEVKEQPANLRQKPEDNHKDDVKTRSRLRGSVTYFDSKGSDSEDDSATQVTTGKSQVGSGFSRRTKKHSPPSSNSVSNPKVGSSSQVLANDSGSELRTPTTRIDLAETPQEPLNRNGNSNQRPNKSERNSSGKEASSSSSSSMAHLASRVSSLPKETRKSSVVEPPTSAEPERKGEKSGRAENQKAPSGTTTISREDSLKKPSHVHPKLPDYDTLAARIQAFRTNHQ